MKPAAFDYVVPETVAEVLGHLADAAGDAALIAGGQTLMPLLALRMSSPALVIDINRISELKGVTKADGALRVAAMTRQNELLASEPAANFPAITTAVRHIGHYQTRNRGTIGGSIALGEPAAELPATAVALGATIEAQAIGGQRMIAAEEFYIGPYATALEPDELVTAIHFPDWSAGSLTVFHELARRPGDFALVGLVGAVTVEAGTISRAGLAWFGMGPTPMKARQAEAALLGQTVADLDFRGLAELAMADADPFDDGHTTADYRRSVGRRIFAKTLGAALDKRHAA